MDMLYLVCSFLGHSKESNARSDGDKRKLKVKAEEIIGVRLRIYLILYFSFLDWLGSDHKDFFMQVPFWKIKYEI